MGCKYNMSFKSVRNEAHQRYQVFIKFFVSYPGDPSVFPVYCDMSNGGEFKISLSLAGFDQKKSVISLTLRFCISTVC